MHPPADDQGGQGSRDAERKGDPGGECRQDDAEREEADQWRLEDIEEREERDQHQGDRREAAEERRPGNEPADRTGDKTAGEFEQAAGDDGTHPHMPGMTGRGRDHLRGSVGGAAGGEECRADDEEHHPEGARRVEAEGHRGHIAPAGLSGQPEGEPGEEQIADHDPHRRPGDEVGEGEVDGELEDGRQEGDGEDEVSEVVEGEAEECVDIPRGRPAVGVPPAVWGRAGGLGASGGGAGGCHRGLAGGEGGPPADPPGHRSFRNRGRNFAAGGMGRLYSTGRISGGGQGPSNFFQPGLRTRFPFTP